MSQLKKLFREVLNGIPDEKSIWDRPAKGPDEYIGEGLTRLKDLWDKTAAADDNKEMPDSAGHITMKQLIRQHNEQNRLLKQHASRFLTCKRILIANEVRSKLDSTVQRAYFGDGGIRFFAKLLQENAGKLDPDHQEVSEMVVSCYNSAILPMMHRRQAMEKKCAVLEQEIRDAETMLTDSASLYRAMGYTPCKQRISDLEQQEKEDSYTDLDQGRKRLKEILDDNREALQKMLAASNPMPCPVPLKNAALRTDMAELLDEEKWRALLSDENQTPEEYASRIRAFCTQMEDRLLKRYLLPDETEIEEKENNTEDIRDE